MMPHCALCVNIWVCVCVCTLKLIRDIKMYFFSLRDMPTVNLFGGKQFKPLHLSLVSWKKSLVERMSRLF